MLSLRASVMKYFSNDLFFKTSIIKISIVKRLLEFNGLNKQIADGEIMMRILNGSHNDVKEE